MHSAVGVHPGPKVPGRKRKRRRWVPMSAPDEKSDPTETPLELGGLLKNNNNHLNGWEAAEDPRRLSRSMSSIM